MVRREPFWQAHRQHFYQRAIDNGFSVPAIVACVFVVNVAAGGACGGHRRGAGQHAVSLAALAAAIAIVAWLLLTFARAKP